MHSQALDYIAGADRLSRAARGLLETLQTPGLDASIAGTDLQAATSTPADLRFAFTASASGAPDTPTWGFEALLLELQSANVLMSAGIAINECHLKADTQFIEQSIVQIDSAKADLSKPRGTLAFAASDKASKDLSEAIQLFRDNAGRTLTSIASGTASTITSLIDSLKKIDHTKIRHQTGRACAPGLSARHRDCRKGRRGQVTRLVLDRVV